MLAFYLIVNHHCLFLSFLSLIYCFVCLFVRASSKQNEKWIVLNERFIETCDRIGKGNELEINQDRQKIKSWSPEKTTWVSNQGVRKSRMDDKFACLCACGLKNCFRRTYKRKTKVGQFHVCFYVFESNSFVVSPELEPQKSISTWREEVTKCAGVSRKERKIKKATLLQSLEDSVTDF